MRPRSKSNAPIHCEVIDGATLYLCRQGSRWVVVIESPRITCAVAFRHTSRDAHDARFQLLSRAREACPGVAIVSTDGARTSEDYEWRIEVRGIAAHPGDLGVALHRKLSTESGEDEGGPRSVIGRRCHWGLSPSFSGRPRTF